MNHSLAVIVSFLLLYTYCASATVIPNKKSVVYKTSEEFNVHIRERGTKFVEKITIDEKNGLETFYVPPHNGLSEANYLYDFKNNMSVNRVESEARCFLRPLPSTLPKPANLKTGLQWVTVSRYIFDQEKLDTSKASHTHSSGKPLLVKTYWGISEQVNKTLLTQEVRDFCGQFPVFRLQKYHLNSATGLGKRNVGGTRLARDLVNLPALCDKSPFPSCTNPRTDPCCNGNNWRYNIKIRNSHCTYWVTGCKLNRQAVQIECAKWDHVFSSMVCYEPKCP